MCHVAQILVRYKLGGYNQLDKIWVSKKMGVAYAIFFPEDDFQLS